jgi:hypothetical protein
MAIRIFGTINGEARLPSKYDLNNSDLVAKHEFYVSHQRIFKTWFTYYSHFYDPN